MANNTRADNALPPDGAGAYYLTTTALTMYLMCRHEDGTIECVHAMPLVAVAREGVR